MYSFSAVSVVSDWDSSHTYVGGEIVTFNYSVYLAQYWPGKSNPSENKAWLELKNFFSPSDFVLEKLYKTGEAVIYKDQVFVAGHNTDYVLPDTSSNHEAWIFADVSKAKGPLFKLPVDPGLAGYESVVGIDSDSDGVRDDLQRRITLHIPDSPEIRAAAMFAALNFCRNIEAISNNPDLTYEDVSLNACLYTAVSKNFIKAEAYNKINMNTLMTWFLNTPERYATYEKFTNIFDGRSFPHDDYDTYKPTCDSILDIVVSTEMERQK